MGEVEKEDEAVEPPGSFPFDQLPVELKSASLDFLNTKFLDEVCSEVSTNWRSIVNDILEIRRNRVEGEAVPEWLSKEIKLRVEPGLEQNSLEILKHLEGRQLASEFNAFSMEVNSDVIKSKTGLLYYLWTLRDCDCQNLAECIIRNLHLIPKFNLILVHADDAPPNNLNFYHLSNIERLHSSVNPSTFKKYTVLQSDPGWFCRPIRQCQTVSLFGDQIALNLIGRKVLILKIVTVDHSKRTVDLERIRFVHLPVWTDEILIADTKLIVLYTTGNIGMWDRLKDDLFMSNDRVVLEDSNNKYRHENKLYRIGDVILVKTHVHRTNKHQWYLVDSNLEIRAINMAELMFPVVQNEGFSRVEDVCHIDLWYNCFLVRMSVRSPATEFQKEAVQSFVFFKRITDYPKDEDFLHPVNFGQRFFSRGDNGNTQVQKIQASDRVSFTSLFVPLSLKPCQFEPGPDVPAVPVADMVGIQITPLDTRLKTPRNKVKAIRVRLANTRNVKK